MSLGKGLPVVREFVLESTLLMEGLRACQEDVADLENETW